MRKAKRDQKKEAVIKLAGRSNSKTMS